MPLDRGFALGPFVLSLGQFFLLLAFAIALLTGVLVARRRQVHVADTLFNALLVGLIAARLAFVARYYDAFDSVWAMFDIRDGGFDVLGGILGALAYVLWRLWRVPAQRVPLASAVAAGGLVWGVTVGSLTLLENESRGLPAVALTTLNGESTTLTRLIEGREQPLVVNLWATWCPPCRREMPMLQAAQRREDDVVFAFVNQGETRPRVQGYLDAESLSLDNLLLDEQAALGRAVGSQVMPTTLLYDGRGQLRDTHYGELSRASLAAMLEKLRH